MQRGPAPLDDLLKMELDGGGGRMVYLRIVL
jgi:hypothetical protein